MSYSVDNGFSMSVSKRRSMLGELSSLLPWANCWRRNGYQRAKSQATIRQRASVAIVVDCVQSNRNHITCRLWRCSRSVTLAARADFPTPGNPPIQITLWPSPLLTSFSISCRMSIRVPGVHGSWRGSLVPPRALTKFSSCFRLVTSLTFSCDDMRMKKEITDNIPWRSVTLALVDLAVSGTMMMNYESGIGITDSPPWRFSSGVQELHVIYYGSWYHESDKLDNQNPRILDLARVGSLPKDHPQVCPWNYQACPVVQSPFPFERQRECTCLRGVDGSGTIPSHMNSYIRVQCLSQSWIKTITSFIMVENSFIVWRSSSEFGTLRSLSSWWARVRILSARLFIDPWDSSWALRCYQFHQSYYSNRKLKENSPGMQHRCKKTPFLL